ncbi:major facilitator superfamily domain-containingprotein [Purpureocillium lavendulum]|uniref:Major facilitator superfamily domain-containingprotein n=1 Tax=Purpureocillium lavendulum TaxID=1247861 RepID=A0AB34FYS8_9HYPO|nr:major facilitator superfamily domain-containingprotein [Purpureocillium lavendulum]
MPALQPLLSLIQRGVERTTVANNASASDGDAVQVICAWPVSGQYGPGSRILYYVLIAACVLAQKSAWIRNACLAAALLLPAVAAVHAIVLAALHVDGAVDMDVFGAFQLCSIGILAAPVTVRLSRTYFNDPGRNTIFLWAGLILAGLLSLTVEFYRIGTSSCSEKEAGIPIPRDTNSFPYGNTTCGLTCSTAEGPFSPMRGGAAKDIYVIPAPDGLTFGTATLLAAACCVHAILWLASMMDKILEINFKAVSRFMDRETHGQMNDPIEGTNGATIGSMKKVNNMVRLFLSVVAVPVFGGAGLAILIVGERNFFSPQVKYQNEPLANIGQWAPIVGTGLAALGSLYMLLKGDGNNSGGEVCKECAHHANRSPSSRDSRSLRGSVDGSDRTGSPHGPVNRAATTSSAANDGTSPLRPSFTTLSRYLTGHTSQAATEGSDVGKGRRKVSRMFHAVGKSFNSAAYEMMDTSEFRRGRAVDFPEIPGEDYRNGQLRRIRRVYNPPRDADGNATPLPGSRSRATSFVGSIRQTLIEFRSSALLLLIVVCAAVFTDIFLYGLLVPVLPFALTSRAGLPVSQIPRWNGVLLALYNLGLCIGSPVFGFLADRVSSRRLPFLAGLVALAASTLLLCLGRSVAVLSVGRVLQENTTGQKVLFGTLLTLMGIALTLSSTPLMAEITYVIEEKEKERPGIWGAKGVYGVGFGLFTTSFALGGVIGSFMAGYLQFSKLARWMVVDLLRCYVRGGHQ